jgi:hypothetical protein
MSEWRWPGVCGELEGVAAREVGRGSAALAAHTSGSLCRAAASLAGAGSTGSRSTVAVILTGFFIADARPPAGETDGPVGAVQLAAALRLLGAEVRVLTDTPCEPVVRAAIVAAGLDVPLDVAPLPTSVGAAGYAEWEAATVAAYLAAAVTHVVAIERPGPGRDGVPRSMRGVDVGAFTAPLERVYAAGDWTRIAIGDGGNEIGMGRLTPGIIAESVPRGADIHCVVGCDELIVGGTSNWGAAALVAALAAGPALVAPPSPGPTADARPGLAALLRPDWSRRVVSAIVEQAGAVDGVRGVPSSTVDGLDWPDYAATLEQIAQLAAPPEPPTSASHDVQ